MEIEFDPVKDEINRGKHGVSLKLAAAIDLNAAAIRPDDPWPMARSAFAPTA